MNTANFFVNVIFDNIGKGIKPFDALAIDSIIKGGKMQIKGTLRENVLFVASFKWFLSKGFAQAGQMNGDVRRDQ